MASSNPLISKDGFRYIFEQTLNPRNSNQVLIELVNSLYPAPTPSSVATQRIEDLKKLKKQFQYQGIAQLISALDIESPKTLIEFCCGNGELSFYLANQLELDLIGLDINPNLIKKNKQRAIQERASKSLDFRVCDICSEDIPSQGYAYLALHSCGSLLDRILDLAVENEPEQLIVVPCCYGKINNSKRVLPKSRSLKTQEDLFLRVLKKATKFEGVSGNHPRSRSDILLNIFRRLVDLDRIFYLQEHGYNVDFVKISPRFVAYHDREYPLSPANTAIVANK
jgi:SAM-dependent methyltransferase